MRKRKRLFGVLLVAAALIIMQLPVAVADAATSSASDFRIEGSTLVKYRGTDTNVSVPDSVEVIAEGAFEDNKNIELVVLPNSVKRIEKYAFWGCDNLDTVVLGRGLTEVGDYAFAGCKGLEQMSIPSNVTSIGIQAFGDCVNLRDISIPRETTSIHESAFDGCHQLTFHCDAGSVAEAYAEAFYEKQEESAEYQDVPGYQEEPEAPETDVPEATPEPAPVYTPAPDTSQGNLLGSTKIVGNRAVIFIDGSNLSVYGSNITPETTPEVSRHPATDFTAEITGNGIPKYTVVDGRVVADQAYYKRQDLGAVSLPAGIQEIGQFAFARSSLTEISVPQGAEIISYGAFYHCNDLKSVSLPDTIVNVEPRAFEHTAWVENFLNGDSAQEGDFLISGGVLVAYRGTGASVIVPEGVRVIAAEAFRGHGEIESVAMPDSLTVIGEAAFENCTGLQRILLNRGLEQVKDRAFANCGADQVVVPASVRKVGLRAFDNVEADYAVNRPETVYEVSATRLSNEAYRVLGTEQGDRGVTVEGPEGSLASLEGAARNYLLRLQQLQDISEMSRAFERAFGSGLPSDTFVYNMTLSDSSQIPLTKLGRQYLTVVLPLEEALRGKELRLYGLDRNGQLEELPFEIISVDGQEAVRFRTNFVSQICLYTTGEASTAQPLEVSVSMTSAAAPPVETAAATGLRLQLYVGGIMLIVGAIMIVFTGFKRKES